MTTMERIKSFPGWRKECKSKQKEFEEWLENIDEERAQILKEIMPVDEFSFWFIQTWLEIEEKELTDRLEKMIRYYKWILKPKRSGETIDLEIVKQIPLESVLENYGIKITRGKTLCPFHKEKTASFSIHKKTNRYKCFGCDESGDVIDFVQKFEKCTFREALERLQTIL